MHEEALAGGLPKAGEVVTAKQTGTLSLSNPDGRELTIKLDLSGLPAMTTGGGEKSVVWQHGATEATVVGTANGKPVIEVSVNGGSTTVAGSASSVSYEVKLLGPVDHPQAGVEDELAFDVPVKVSDGVSPEGSTSVTVKIADDSPEAQDVTQTITAKTVFYANVMLSVDLSGSMDRPASGMEGSRLEAAKEAVKILLDEYHAKAVAADEGGVKVFVTEFAGSAKNVTNGWVDITTQQGLDAAKHAIDAMTASGSTNYDAGLQQLIKAYGTEGKLGVVGVQNVSYFLSDGAPTVSTVQGSGAYGSTTEEWRGDGIGTDRTGATETTRDDYYAPGHVPGKITTEIGEGDWINFLEANSVVSHAIGMGNVPKQYLDPIAYDGVKGVNTDAIVVTDFSDLSSTLLEHSLEATPAAGSLLRGDIGAPGGAMGADGGYVASITVDGVTYSYDGHTVTAGNGAVTGEWSATGRELTVHTQHGGTLTLNMGVGTYKYQPPAVGDTGASEQVAFVLSDTDGDTSSATLTFELVGTQTLDRAAGDDAGLSEASSGDGATEAASVMMMSRSAVGDGEPDAVAADKPDAADSELATDGAKVAVSGGSADAGTGEVVGGEAGSSASEAPAADSADAGSTSSLLPPEGSDVLEFELGTGAVEGGEPAGAAGTGGDLINAADLLVDDGEKADLDLDALIEGDASEPDASTPASTDAGPQPVDAPIDPLLDAGLPPVPDLLDSNSQKVDF